MQLSIIIVNYNVRYYLEQCLCSVIKALRNLEGEIIVIDNYSTDRSFSFFKDKFPQVHFVWNEINAGFAKANNQALSMAKGEYILFLNPDTIVPEDCFEKCITFLGTNNGALGIKMLDGTGAFLRESKRSFPSPLTSLYKLFGLYKLFPHSKIFAKYHLGNLSENENHEVDVLAGAFMMIPRKILEKVGGFDEDFFMYGEDIDLSYRIQKAGYINYYFSESSIIHFKGESTKKGSLNYVKMFYKAMSIFVKKHYGGKRAGLYSIFIHAAILARAAIAAVSRLIKKKWKEGKKVPQYTEFLIIANDAEFKNIRALLENNQQNQAQFVRYDPSGISSGRSLNTYSEIIKIAHSSPEKQIIFCEGTLTFKNIIAIMQQIAGFPYISIFSTGCSGLIGSILTTSSSLEEKEMSGTSHSERAV